MLRPLTIPARALIGLVVGPPELRACATCFGASDSAMAQGVNLGIFALLGCIGLVLAGVATRAVVIGTRAARYARAGAEGDAAICPATHIDQKPRLTRTVERSR